MTNPRSYDHVIIIKHNDKIFDKRIGSLNTAKFCNDLKITKVRN